MNFRLKINREVNDILSSLSMSIGFLFLFWTLEKVIFVAFSSVPIILLIAYPKGIKRINSLVDRVFSFVFKILLFIMLLLIYILVLLPTALYYRMRQTTSSSFKANKSHSSYFLNAEHTYGTKEFTNPF